MKTLIKTGEDTKTKPEKSAIQVLHFIFLNIRKKSMLDKSPRINGTNFEDCSTSRNIEKKEIR